MPYRDGKCDGTLHENMSKTRTRIHQSRPRFKIPHECSDYGKEEDLQGFLLDEKKIEEAIKSRDDLSANGIDGISYRVIKGAGAEGVKFMRTLIRGIIKNGRVMSSWKEGRTILIHKKGDRDEIGNWRLISITNCMHRIFTCLMAIQDINSRTKIFRTPRKDLSKKQMGVANME
jgi:hypothetical protein